MAAVFTASGLASGMDTSSIVSALVKIESAPITRLQTQQAALTSQVSLLGQIMSSLTTLGSVASSLGTSGTLASTVTSSNTSFTATTNSSAQSGRYSVEVDQLATAAKWRSAAFPSGGSSPMAGGSISLSASGTTYDAIQVTAGESLADVAYAINNPTINGTPASSPVSAIVLSGKDGTYLSVTAKNTGFDPSNGGTAANALQLAFTPDGTGGGTDPAFAQISAASNALFSVDQLAFERQTNTVTDAIPGVSLALTHGATPPATTGTPEDLVVANDASSTQANLQKFVDAYNGVMSLVQAQLNVTKDTDRSSTLAGDPAIRSLQASLQSLLVAPVAGAGTVTTLAGLGLKTAHDGSLSIDTTTLNAAMASDPNAFNAIFSTASTGLASTVQNLVDQQTLTGSGVLALDQKGMNDQISAITAQTATLQEQVTAYQDNLNAEFAAMESTISNLKATGTYLTAQSSTSSGG
jgi:flagellar hook-associated protein 2